MASIGLFLQFFIGIVALVFGLMRDDTAFVFAAAYILTGILVWLGLIIIFNQHKLERLEALEDDELAATRGSAGTFFEKATEESLVASRRLSLMHAWFMPALSLFIAAALSGLALWMLNFMAGVKDYVGVKEIPGVKDIAARFALTEDRGWAVSICLGAAAASFVFSRFVAGMAKQPAWQNLRGGAAYMVGNAIVLVAVAAGIVFRFFENDSVIRVIAWAIPVFLFVQVAEIVLNFVLNLYRPRIPGDVPRPAFDSKLLSLVAMPDSIVRSLNEAVNYQFGFDVTSSWGYQLLLRSFVSLVVLGFAALLLLSTMVVVEPHQQAVRLRGGRIIDDKVHTSGVMWKLPWPIESADVHDVTKIRKLHLTAKVIKDREKPMEQRVILWGDDETPTTDETLDPFVVGSPQSPSSPATAPEPVAKDVPANSATAAVKEPDRTPEEIREDRAVQQVSSFYSLVDAEIVLEYRIKRDGNGLLQYLDFAHDSVGRRQTLTDRERALKNVALTEVTQYLSQRSLDEVLSPGLSNLAENLRQRIRAAFDRENTGVDVVAVDLPMLRPSGNSAPKFEEYGVGVQSARQARAVAEREMHKNLTWLIGKPELIDPILTNIDKYNELVKSNGGDSAAAIEQRHVVEKLLTEGGGLAAQQITDAQSNRWYYLMMQRAKAVRVEAELATYRAAPEIYRQREKMRVFRAYLPNIPKFIIGIDPSKVSVDADLKSVNPFVDFAPATEDEMKKK